MKGFEFSKERKSYSVRRSIVDEIEASITQLVDGNAILNKIGPHEINGIRFRTLNQLRVSSWRLEDEHQKLAELSGSYRFLDTKSQKIAGANIKMLNQETQCDFYLFFYLLNQLFRFTDKLLRGNSEIKKCYLPNKYKFDDAVSNLPPNIKNDLSLLYWFAQFTRDELDHHMNTPLGFLNFGAEQKSGLIHTGLVDGDQEILQAFNSDTEWIISKHPNKSHLQKLYPIKLLEELYPWIANPMFKFHSQNQIKRLVEKYGTGPLNLKKPLILFRDLYKNIVSWSGV